MIALVQILLALSVACVCVCMAEEKRQIHLAAAVGIKNQVGRVERKSNDEIDSGESILTGGERGRRSLTQSDRTNSLTKMNNLRRTVGASNMPYLSYDVGAESDAASWTAYCNYDKTFNDPNYANGFKYLTTNSLTIASVIDELYKLFPKEMSSVYLTSFGCDLRQCSTATYNGIRYQNAQLTLCLFKGESEYDQTKVQYKLGEGCTECNRGSYWCDYGLCRADCSSSDSCFCNSYCLNCANTSTATCRCQCPEGWTGLRCESNDGTNATEPTCITTPRIPLTWTTKIISSSTTTKAPTTTNSGMNVVPNGESMIQLSLYTAIALCLRLYNHVD